MFVTNEERNGSGYIEFQYCKEKTPFFFSKILAYMHKNFLDDSIFVDIDDFEDKLINLYPTLKKIDLDFDMFGPNYFDKEQTANFLELINQLDDYDYTVLKRFLKNAIEKYNGIYIIGV